MAQPIKIIGEEKKIIKKSSPKKVIDKRLPPPVKKSKVKRKHPQYGTSKLEDDFAKEFLDKLGIKYIYQYKMESIGRYLDFFCPEENVAIEVDGDYWHGYNKLHEDKNPMQKHSEWVDKQKDEWALERGIPIIRIWEHDIRNNPQKVRGILKERMGEYKEKYIKELNKKKRH